MTIRKVVTLIVLAFLISFFVGLVRASPGGVDANGCHKSKKDDIHCHAERAKNSGGSDGTQAARIARLKRECRAA